MIKMKMFGLVKATPSPSATKPTKPTPVLTGSKSSKNFSSGKMFNLKNLDSIMKMKNTGCKSCGR